MKTLNQSCDSFSRLSSHVPVFAVQANTTADLFLTAGAISLEIRNSDSAPKQLLITR